jgi:type VI protein secretion system component Hcp
MSSDCFISMDQIPGEAQDKDFIGAIEVTSWNWGVSSRGDVSMNMRRGVADVRHFTFVHALDSASAGLLSRCATAILVPKATLTQRRAGGKTAQRFLEIKFTQLRIVDVSLALTAANDVVGESVTFSFETVSFDYTPQSSAGADKSGRHNFSWIAGAAK